MELNTTEDIVAYLREWSMDKLDEVESIGAKDAIYKEFEEWIEVEDKNDIEIMALEPLEEYYDEKGVDTLFFYAILYLLNRRVQQGVTE